MIWYFDDGDLNMVGYNKPDSKFIKGRPSISVKGYDLDALNETIKTLNENLNLSLYYKQYKKLDSFNSIIYINSQDKNKLFPIWRDLAREHNLPQCMLYKLDL